MAKLLKRETKSSQVLNRANRMLWMCSDLEMVRHAQIMDFTISFTVHFGYCTQLWALTQRCCVKLLYEGLFYKRLSE